MQPTRSAYISFGEKQLHYLQMGVGKRLLITFPGYGNNAAIFAPFHKYLHDEFTMICMDLPHHGKSDWKDKGLLQKHDLKLLIEGLKIQFSVEKISLMGYSIGGRICLKLIEQMPESIEQAVLLAPDGLVFNPFYYFVTSNFFGKKIFKRFLSNPKHLRLIEQLHKRNIIQSSRYKFAMYYISSEKDRKFLYNVWSDLSQIVPDKKLLRAAIRTHKIPINIFMGSNDRVIPLAHAHKFKTGLDSVKLFVLNKAHRVMDDDTIPRIAQCLINGTC